MSKLGTGRLLSLTTMKQPILGIEDYAPMLGRILIILGCAALIFVLILLFINRKKK